jgi:hypothetical protein
MAYHDICFAKLRCRSMEKAPLLGCHVDVEDWGGMSGEVLLCILYLNVVANALAASELG